MHTYVHMIDFLENMAANQLEVKAMVRGYHIYKDIWEATLGENLECQRESGNIHNINAVAVLKSGLVVGHIPKRISFICSLFLRHGGSIHCIVSGAKRYSADLKWGGLEVSCILKFESDNLKLQNKTKKLVVSALSISHHEGLVQSCHKVHQKEVDQLDNIPKAKKMKLSVVHGINCTDWQRGIVNGEMLSDIPINIAQSLFKKQFPDIKGLQPTVYQLRNQAMEDGTVQLDSTNQLQIIHCRGNHWIVASSVGCTKGMVNIYDSLYTSLDETTILLVSSLFGCQYQMQRGGTDCGLFAIAVITAIANGKDPSQLQI